MHTAWCTRVSPDLLSPALLPACLHYPLQCPNLKAIQSMGAGVDSMIHEPSLPRHVPLLRVIDPLSEWEG